MMNQTRSRVRRGLSALTATSVVLVLAGCVEAPPPRPVRAAPLPPVNVEVYAYPQNGQTPDQQGRDRYECSLWATQQTGFDPSAANVPPEYRVHVNSGPPPGTNTALGAITGAIIGAAAGNGAAGPALFGAAAGAVVGSAVDANNASQSRDVYVQDRRAYAALQQQASSYRRAIGACLEGRGYSVR
jgi:hypothetical protein